MPPGPDIPTATGERIEFFVSTNPVSPFRMDICRMPGPDVRAQQITRNVSSILRP
jgi:hypothetical protein